MDPNFLNAATAKIASVSLLLTVALSSAAADPAVAMSFKPNLRFWGAELGAEFSVPIAPERINGLVALAFGGGLETGYLFRYFGAPSVNGAGDTAGVSAGLAGVPGSYAFDDLNFQAVAGGGAELLAGDWSLKTLALYQGRWEKYTAKSGGHATLFASGRSDRDGLQENLVAIVAAAGHRQGKSLALFGAAVRLRAELAVRWAPSWFLNAQADYWRTTASSTALVQIFHSANADLYLADRFTLDRLDGAAIPLHALTTLGGSLSPVYKEEPALGGAIRGFAKNRLDGRLKIVNNAELRLSFPVVKYFTPLAVAYFDAGAVDFLEADAHPVITSTGLTLGARIADALDVGYAVNFALNPAGTEPLFSHGVVLGSQFSLP